MTGRGPSLKLVLITGLSGAGKSNAVNCFEDLDYFCVDNLPPTFIPKFAELCAHSEGKINRVALVCDIRGGTFFDDLFEVLDQLEESGVDYDILFLEAEQEVIIRRFKETRRRHPLTGGTLSELLRQEKEVLSELRGRADHIINTSSLSPAQLKEKIARIYTEAGLKDRKILIQLVSFGFKYGLPPEADLVFDVRFIPNPFYVEHLKPLKGTDPRIRKYIYRWSVSHKYYQKIRDLLQFIIPYCVREGKSSLVVAIGCTGVRHRSVVIADDLVLFLEEQYSVNLVHRDIEKVII